MRTALIVDDNSDIRILLSQALKLEGFKILEAENGEDAKSQLKHMGRPCLVLLDLMMPVMDGKQFLTWKNKQPEYAEIPVVVISALPKEGKLLEGTKGHFRKPLDLANVIETVENYCK